MGTRTTTGRASRSRFEHGTGCFTCESCGRKTRQTGEQGGLPLCPDCFDQAGWQNSVSDYGSEPEELSRSLVASRDAVRNVYARGGSFADYRGEHWAEVSRIDEIHELALAEERSRPIKLTGSMNWEAPIGPDGREALPLTTVDAPKAQEGMMPEKAKAKRTRTTVSPETVAAIIKARDGGATWNECGKIAPHAYRIYWQAKGAEARSQTAAAKAALKAWETRRSGKPAAKAPAKAKAKAKAPTADAKREAKLKAKREAEAKRRARIKAAARK